MTAPGSAPALEMRGVSRNYSALRPLRIAELTVAAGERVSIGGIDAGGAELLVNLVTGASLPETGEIRVFGRSTAAITDGDEWLDSLDRFGIVSPRGILLEGSTLLQNLAMPFTLEIDPVAEEIAARCGALARQCGIDAARWLPTPAGALPPEVRVRAHLARALALEPQFLILEHPTAGVEEASARGALASDLARACDGLTALVLTNDDAFARAVAPRNLRLDGATGALKVMRKGWLTW